MRCTNRQEKSRILAEVVANLGYHRKYAIQQLQAHHRLRPRPIRRQRPLQYQEALPAIRLAWEALDYPCAERLHPVLATTVEQLAAHGELSLNATIRRQLTPISRSTLARRLARMDKPKVRSLTRSPKAQGRLRSEVPLGRFDFSQTRPGALEIDRVEHNGGSSLGQFAYTLHVLDVVSGFSLRRAVLGRSQRVVFEALQALLRRLPFPAWAPHTDNGSEFLNGHRVRFARDKGLTFHRSRPYRKNDQPYIEQKNRPFVRELVGYDRYDTPEQVDWLNQVYDLFDLYANLFVPMRKLTAKARQGPRVRKTYDTAQTPFERLAKAGVLEAAVGKRLQEQRRGLNRLALHRRLEDLLAKGAPPAVSPTPAAAQEDLRRPAVGGS